MKDRLLEYVKLPYDWLNTKYQALPSYKTFSAKIRDTLYQTSKITKTLYHSIDPEIVIQRVEGFSRMFDWSSVTFYARKPKVRTVLNQAIYANLLFTGIIAYDVLSYLILNALSNEQNNQFNVTFNANLTSNAQDNYHSNSLYLAYLTSFFADRTIDIYYAPLWVSMNINNIIFNNNNVATIVGSENEDPEHLKSCGCSDANIFFAKIYSTVSYIVDMSVLKIIEKLLPYGFYLVYPIRARINGRALTELNLSRMCSFHRNKILAQNNGFSDGIGFAYQGTVDSIFFLMGFIGIKHKYIYDALAYSFFHVFSMISLLTNKPLPGKKEEVDLLYYAHLVINVLFDQLSKSIFAFIQEDIGNCDFLYVPQTLDQFIPNVILEGQTISEYDLRKSFADYLSELSHSLPGKSQTAYIISKDRSLFYLDKKKKACEFIDISNDQHAMLDAQLLKSLLLLHKKHEKEKCLIAELTEKQLQLITTITDHSRYIEWEKWMTRVMAFPPVHFANHYLLDKAYRSGETALKLPPIKLFFDLNGASFREKILFLKRTQKKWLPYLVKLLLDKGMLSRFASTRLLLQILLNKNTLAIANEIEFLLNIHDNYQQEIKANIKAELITAHTVNKNLATHENPLPELVDDYKPQILAKATVPENKKKVEENKYVALFEIVENYHSPLSSTAKKLTQQKDKQPTMEKSLEDEFYLVPKYTTHHFFKRGKSKSLTVLQKEVSVSTPPAKRRMSFS